VTSVYLETSFFSACVWERHDPEGISWQDQSRRWWVQQRRNYDLCTSAETIRELSAPNFRNRKEALDLTAGVRQLPTSDEVSEFAQLLVRERAMPGPAEKGDALHVAAAAVHRIEYLLTWNVKHLANPNKVKHLQAICGRAGLPAPQLVTPPFLWIEEGSI
jgi:predicted nucleic acid-binding protein